MNDDKFIEEALKEHARHEGAQDQEFLDELEAKLDGKPEVKVVRRTLDRKNSPKRAAWMSAAALVIVAVSLGALYQTRTKTDVIAEASEESPSLLAYSVTSPEVADIVPLAPRFATRVERKRLVPSGSKAKIIAANSSGSIPIPAPVGSNSTQAFFENFDEGYLGDGWGDGDGEGSGGGLRQIPIQGRGGNKYGALIERGFLTPIKAPLSTFSIDVDTASYTNIRRHVEDRIVIDPDAVRIEEMINYFYLDSLQESQKVFQRKLTGTIETIAKDVKIQVEFNPGKVAQYRLLGYANRRLKDEDFANDKIDAGDIGAGHTVTALYEIIPVGAEVPSVPGDLKYQKIEREVLPLKVIDSAESLTVKFRYKLPDGDISTEFSQALTDEGRTLKNASEDFRFAASVALWGMLLRDSEYAGDGTIEMVEELALDATGDDRQGDRAEFLDLVRKWSSGL